MSTNGSYGSNVIFLGWKRVSPVHEQQGMELFQEMTHYLDTLQRDKTIQSYDVVFLDPNGGSLTGFFLLRGDSAKLDTLQASEEWQINIGRAMLYLEDPTEIRGATGEEIQKRVVLWPKIIG
jgi:hypothetical protein